MIAVDTNILIYAAGLHGEDDVRTALARALMKRKGELSLSVQVMREFFVASTRSSRQSVLEDDEALLFIEQWTAGLPLSPITRDLFESAAAIRKRFRFHYYDCEVIAAALADGCDTLYSEDMQHGQVIEGLRIVNPFV